MTIGISQSGETKDTIDAISEAKKYQSKISSICNVIGSTLSRLTGNGAYLHAGPEFAVASTKVFSNMIIVGLIFALTISNIPDAKRKSIVTEMRKLPNSIYQQLIDDDGAIEMAADIIVNSENPPIFIGRGDFLPTFQKKVR